MRHVVVLLLCPSNGSNGDGQAEDLDGPFVTEDGAFYFVTEDDEYFQQEAA
jgi:hypothetical protein